VTTVWICVALVGLATVAIKASGPLLAAERELPGPLGRMVDLLAPAVLAALVATQTFGSGQTVVIDERAAGMAVAGVAVALRAPILFVVVSAAAATALLRL
jgi:branched-subunit amino acid transport protein